MADPLDKDSALNSAILGILSKNKRKKFTVGELFHSKEVKAVFGKLFKGRSEFIYDNTRALFCKRLDELVRQGFIRSTSSKGRTFYFLK